MRVRPVFFIKCMSCGYSRERSWWADFKGLKINQIWWLQTELNIKKTFSLIKGYFSKIWTSCSFSWTKQMPNMPFCMGIREVHLPNIICSSKKSKAYDNLTFQFKKRIMFVFHDCFKTGHIVHNSCKVGDISEIWNHFI